MSETLNQQEQQFTPENSNEDLDAALEQHLEELRAEAKEASAKQYENKDRLKDTVEQSAKTAAEINIDQDSGGRQGQGGLTVLGTQKELKSQAYERKLKQVQSHLNKPERTFSKVVHQWAVNNASEAGAKTIMRASGILGGSLAALLGSLGLLYAAKHYGFSYNYFSFFLLFICGYIIGVLIEAVLGLVRRRSS